MRLVMVLVLMLGLWPTAATAQTPTSSPDPIRFALWAGGDVKAFGRGFLSLRTLYVAAGVGGTVLLLSGQDPELTQGAIDLAEGAGTRPRRILNEVGNVTWDLVDAVAADAGADAAEQGALSFDAPMSGRFYGRPSPGEPPFVAQGDTVTRGQTVGLLEVMKTFNRVVYGGDGLPERARVIAVVPEDESDLDAGDIILQLEPA